MWVASRAHPDTAQQCAPCILSQAGVVEHRAVELPRIQLEAKTHPGYELNWEILPGAAVPLQTHC